MTEESTIRRNDEIAPARPSLTFEKSIAKNSDAREIGEHKKTGGRSTRVRAKKRKKKKSEKFVRLSLELIKSKAYLNLTPSAARMLIQFLAKPGEAFGIPLSDPQVYHATFNFTYTEAAKLQCQRATFIKVVEALVWQGFVDPVRRGGVFHGKKVCSLFKLSQRWRAYGTASFRPVDYRRWAVTGGRETMPPQQQKDK